MLDLRFSAGSRTSSLNVVHGDEAEIAFTPTVGSRFFDVSSNFCLSRCPFRAAELLWSTRTRVDSFEASTRQKKLIVPNIAKALRPIPLTLGGRGY